MCDHERIGPFGLLDRAIVAAGSASVAMHADVLAAEQEPRQRVVGQRAQPTTVDGLFLPALPAIRPVVLDSRDW